MVCGHSTWRTWLAQTRIAANKPSSLPLCPLQSWSWIVTHQHPLDHTSLVPCDCTGEEGGGGGSLMIAVDGTLHHLVAKVTDMMVMEEMGDLHSPVHLGYGVRRGSEAAVHAATQYMKNLCLNCVLKQDVQNAFNSFHWDRMLEAVQNFSPSVFPLVHSAYSSPWTLFWEDRIIQSAEGMQQDDPLDPLLFRLTIHQICSRLKSELCLFYLDEVLLEAGGAVEDVLHDLDLIVSEGAELCLHLNRHKSEIICPDHISRGTLLFALPNACVTDLEKATLLGSPIGNISCISDMIQEKIRTLKTIEERLSTCPPMMLLYCSTTCFLSPKLQDYDNLLRLIVSGIVSIHFDQTQPGLKQHYQWKNRNLEIRSSVQLAPSAYLASAAACSELVCHILHPQIQSSIPTPYQEEAEIMWSQGLDTSPLEGTR